MRGAKAAWGLLCAVLLTRAFAAPPAEIDYQGKLSIQGVPFSGPGYFKFAITGQSETTNAWSNDGTATGEPAGGCELAVTDGRFSTLLGAAPMQALDPAAFAAGEPLFLRVWFGRDGEPFRELKPKQKIVSSPYALNALRLDGRDGAFFRDASNLDAGTIPEERLGAAVSKLGATIGAGEIDAGAVGAREIAEGSVRLEDLAVAELDARYVNAEADAIGGPLRIAGNLCVGGSVGIGTNQPAAALHVTGPGRFDAGIPYLAPLGDLSMGSFTNRP